MKIKRKSRRNDSVCPLLLFLFVLCAALTAPRMDGAARAVDFDRECSLTVLSGSVDFEEELKDANVVVDLYQVAQAREVSGYDTYTYEFLEGFESLVLSENPDAEEWKSLSQKAAEIAFSGREPAVKGVPFGEKISGMKCGLYLVIARGADVSDYVVTVEDEAGNKSLATIANSGEYTYSVAPALVSLPEKDADENGNISTDSAGDWKYDVTAALKMERDVRYGSLEIVKTLKSYETKDPATFVFLVEAKTGDQLVYSDVASISFTSPGEKKTLLTRIPVGAEVTVTEIYSGAVYQPETGDTQKTVIAADEVVSVSFTNRYDETNNGGGAVTNHFEYNSDTGWGWTKIKDNE